ncbi:MAG: hypothetical protein JRJ47_14440 [Deltaproteobacteria bacterium]|nr:hypothetical protein [Deltaproteobacteria bacterium]
MLKTTVIRQRLPVLYHPKKLLIATLIFYAAVLAIGDGDQKLDNVLSSESLQEERR